MSTITTCTKCNGQGFETHGEYRFICGDCMGLKEVCKALTRTEILFACRSFETWINIKYDNHSNKKDRQFLGAWAQLGPDIDHSILIRKILSGETIRPRSEIDGERDRP